MRTVIYLYEQKFRAWRKRLSGVYRYAKENGWNVRGLEISELKGDFMTAVKFWNASGAVIEGGVYGNAKLKALPMGRYPVVWCDFDEKRVGVTCFGVQHDSSGSAKQAISELTKKGFSTYGYVGFYVKREWSKQRERVFLEEIERTGAKAEVFDPTLGGRFNDATEFYGALEDWLCGLERPCGIFAANDEMGDHVLRAARNRGIAVPDEMAVIGVDNDELLCENTIPTLASVSPDFEKSGYLASDLLSRRIDNPKLSPQVLSFGDGVTMVRESIRKFKYQDFAALKAVEFIRLHAAEGLKVGDVAKAMHVGRRSAELRFSRFVGHSIQNEIESVRFRLACDLIRRPNVRVDTVYSLVGYRNERSLRHLFYKYSGLSPSAWRSQYCR